MTPEELDEARALEAYREWLEEGCDGDDIDGHINDIVITTSFIMARAFLAGARMAREQERERAEVLVEYVEIHTRRLDGVGARAVVALAKYRGEAYSDD